MILALGIVACILFLLAALPFEPVKPWNGHLVALGLFFFSLSFIWGKL